MTNKYEVCVLKLTSELYPYSNFTIKLKHKVGISYMWRCVNGKMYIIRENNWWFEAWETLK